MKMVIAMRRHMIRSRGVIRKTWRGPDGKVWGVGKCKYGSDIDKALSESIKKSRYKGDR